MSSEVEAIPVQAVHLRRFARAQSILMRFMMRRNRKGTIGIALAFGLFTAVNAIGFNAAYETEAAREQLAQSLGSNAGLMILLGKPVHIDTVTGFTDWRVLGTVTLIGSVWAFMRATKLFRGEEDAGRFELFLAGQTTARRAASAILGALIINAVMLFGVVAVLVVGVTRSLESSFSITGSLSYSLVIATIIALFWAVGALASQIMSTKGRAASLSAVVFGVFFLLRSMADSAMSLEWLQYLTPLGWLQKVHPLTQNNVVWFLPVFACIFLIAGVTIYLAGKRDMGGSLISGKETAKARLRLLSRPLGIGFRLTRATTIGWLIGISSVALLLGSLAKSAGDAIGASGAAEQVVSRLSASAQVSGVLTYLGIAFFMAMLLIMMFVASSVSALRNEEAEGYLDNLLVRPVSRASWAWGRVFLTVAGIVLAAQLVGIAAWLGTASQQAGVAYGDLFRASINAIAPGLFLLGTGVLVWGFAPRYTAIVTYGIVAWSFVVQMIGSILNLSPWILDLSLLHHIALAPATDPNWSSVVSLALLGVMGCAAGIWRFKNRDLQNE